MRFDRAPNGSLTSTGCIVDVGDLGSTGCPTAQGLNFARSVAVSPDGGSVYAVSSTDSAIVRFAREVPPVCHTSSSSGEPGATQTISLNCSDPNGDPTTIEVVQPPADGTLGAVNHIAQLLHL